MNTTTFAVARRILPLPVIHGVMERRMLLNFRCTPEALQRLLPAPFRPKLVGGWGIAGICLIRLTEVRPACLPLGGLNSENSAHRIAVEWVEGGTTREGVYIPRRDTSSWLNRLAGGRVFPGVHHGAQFRVWEARERFKVELRSDDGVTFVRVAARVADAVTEGSVFPTLAAAREFFQGGALGWSARNRAHEYDGLELHCDEWPLRPLFVERVESSFFDNTTMFPPGSAVFDSAFVMQNIRHTWQGRGKLLATN